MDEARVWSTNGHLRSGHALAAIGALELDWSYIRYSLALDQDSVRPLARHFKALYIRFLDKLDMGGHFASGREAQVESMRVIND